MKKTIDSITLKSGQTITDFPTYKENQSELEAKKFLKKVDKERHAKFDFVHNRLKQLKKEFQKQFNCQPSDVDYYIFNSINKELI